MSDNDSLFFEKEHENFIQTDLYKKLQNDFKYLFLDLHNENNYTYHGKLQQYHRQEQFNKSTLYYSIFIYLNSIINDSHEKIADVGCGYNFLKRYFSNVVGYDKTEFADYQEFFDEDFISKHQDEFDIAFAINSLHFISLKDFASRINDFGKIVVDGGYGFLTFNLQRMIEDTDEKFLENYNTIEDFYNYINQEIKKIDYKVVACDNLLLYNVKLMDIKRQNFYNQLKGSDWPSYNDFVNNNYTGVNQQIHNEIKNYIALANEHYSYDTAIDDGQSGNIRLIFQKEDK